MIIVQNVGDRLGGQGPTYEADFLDIGAGDGGNGGGGGGGTASDFFRFFAFVLNLVMLLELGNDASDNGGIFAGNGGETGARGGGEHGGMEDGGEIEVTSTMSSEGDRERARLSDEWELGDGESSGAGGGGSAEER